MKSTVPLIITAVVGAMLIIAAFVPPMTELTDVATVHFDILAAIAFILGGGNLLRAHGARMLKQQAGWGYSACAVVAFLVTLTVGFLKIPYENEPGKPGFYARQYGPGAQVAWVYLDIAPDGKRTLDANVRGGETNGQTAVTLGNLKLGEIKLDEHGGGNLQVVAKPDDKARTPEAEAVAGAQAGTSVALAGASLSLAEYGALTNDYNQNGSAFWFMYEFGMRPLQSTMFAMLAFYVASAAFRAFRARNVESVLLLGTAFVILLGRTYLGTYLTSFLPDDGPWSQLQIPNIVAWLMKVFNTAGTRAIMIGIALGIASTSLKVLLGIDRSALGGEKG